MIWVAGEHEPLSDVAWDGSRAREAITRIVSDAESASRARCGPRTRSRSCWTARRSPRCISAARIEQVDAERVRTGRGRHTRLSRDVGAALFLCACLDRAGEFPVLGAP